MSGPNVRSFAFTMTGLTDRESAVVEKFLKHITEVAEAQGRRQDLIDDGIPMLCMMLAAHCPDYSAKEVMGVAAYVINNVEAALTLANNRDGGRA